MLRKSRKRDRGVGFKMPFGTFEGWPLSALPDSYFRLVLARVLARSNNVGDPRFAAAVEREADRRDKITLAEARARYRERVAEAFWL